MTKEIMRKIISVRFGPACHYKTRPYTRQNQFRAVGLGQCHAKCQMRCPLVTPPPPPYIALDPLPLPASPTNLRSRKHALLEKNASRTDGQMNQCLNGLTDGWTDRLSYDALSAFMKFRIHHCNFEILLLCKI